MTKKQSANVKSHTPICHPKLLENLFIEGDSEAQLRKYIRRKGYFIKELKKQGG